MALLLTAVALVSGCAPTFPQKIKDDLVAADKAFSARSAKDGPKKAYLAYFDEDAKILNQYHLGQVGISDMFAQMPPDAIITWEPSFVDVSNAGDIGYTWGRYTLTIPRVGPVGRPFMQMGYYSSVWKRSRLGQWRVVMRAAIPDGQK
jgi:ketosteroid isomerase-like protein